MLSLITKASQTGSPSVSERPVKHRRLLRGASEEQIENGSGYAQARVEGERWEGVVCESFNGLKFIYRLDFVPAYRSNPNKDPCSYP